MLSLPVALFQMDVIFGDADKNIEKIQSVATSVKVENTLLVVPELCLTGYSKIEIQRTAFSSSNNEYLLQLKDICSKFNLRLYGSIAEYENGCYYNTAVFIDKSGLLATYRKTHLFGPMGEKALFNHGDKIVAVEYDNQKYGLSICYDLRFPGMYQQLANEGANIFLIVAEWPITRVSHWTSLLQARAIENQVFVIGVNRVGTDGNYNYGGHSAIYSPFGELITQINHSNEEVKSATIEMKLVNDFREKFDIRNDKLKEIDLI